MKEKVQIELDTAQAVMIMLEIAKSIKRYPPKEVKEEMYRIIEKIAIAIDFPQKDPIFIADNVRDIALALITTSIQLGDAESN